MGGHCCASGSKLRVNCGSGSPCCAEPHHAELPHSEVDTWADTDWHKMEQQEKAFQLGELVERRDTGYEWGTGYVTSVIPLMVTVKRDPAEEGYKWAQVRKIQAKDAEVTKQAQILSSAEAVRIEDCLSNDASSVATFGDVGHNSTAAADINISSLTDLTLEPRIIRDMGAAWKAFVSSKGSLKAAGDAIYSGVAPSLNSIFSTQNAVLPERLASSLGQLCTVLDDPSKLKSLVETLSFSHLHLDVTLPRVIIFRDAILEVFRDELSEAFGAQAQEGWKKLLNYVGGAIIFTKRRFC